MRQRNEFECTSADIINSNDLPTFAAVALQAVLSQTHDTQRVFCPNNGSNYTLPGSNRINAATIAYGLGVRLREAVVDTLSVVAPWVKCDDEGTVLMRGFALYVQRPTEDDTIN